MAGNLTDLLQALERGDRTALDGAFALVYAELKRLAHAQRRRGGNESLSTTALVHEVYVKFAQAGEIAAEGREHFYNIAARAMRQVLLDRARAARSGQRPPAGARQSLDGALAMGGGALEALSADLLDLDRVLSQLRELDPRLSEVAELHLFAGLEFAEIAALRSCAERTVFRDWRKARAILTHALDQERAGA